MNIVKRLKTSRCAIWPGSRRAAVGTCAADRPARPERRAPGSLGQGQGQGRKPEQELEQEQELELELEQEQEHRCHPEPDGGASVDRAGAG